MNQNTNFTALMGGFKPIDVKLLLKPLYADFLIMFNMMFDQNKNKEFMKELMRNYDENNVQKFFECINKELKEINSKYAKLKSNNKLKYRSKDSKFKISKLINDFNEIKSRVNKADKTFIFKFIEGKLVQSITNKDRIFLMRIILHKRIHLTK